MISIINIPTCLCEDNTQYTNCSHAFNCESKIRNLKYPFWGGNRKQYCGSVAADPNTELTCEQSVPKITINFAKYRILDWDNTTQKLTVARDDYSRGDVCAVNNNYKNSSFDNTLFQRYNGDVSTVTLLYNCDAAPNSQNLFGRVDCGDGKYVVYTVVYAASGICTPSVIVVIPILGTLAAQLVSGNGLKDALKDGFDLKWTGNYGQCQGCIGSGGVCGNDGGSEFRCFCKDGPHTTSCSSEKAYSSGMSIISHSPTRTPSDTYYKQNLLIY
jgi:hypothetical protein